MLHIIFPSDTDLKSIVYTYIVVSIQSLRVLCFTLESLSSTMTLIDSVLKNKLYSEGLIRMRIENILF